MLVSGLEMTEALGADFEICLCWVFSFLGFDPGSFSLDLQEI